MISLYGEIKSYISRIKTYLLTQLETLASPDCEKTFDVISQEAKTTTRYLLIFGDDRNNLKYQFLKIKS